VRQFPSEFEALLSKRGLAVLRQGVPAEPFTARTGLLRPEVAQAIPALLERALSAHLRVMEEDIPPWTISGVKHNYAELLPKTVRVRTAMLESRRAKAFERASECGLVGMLRSESFGAFAQALAGRPLRRQRSTWGIQALCYRAGDYSGPHTDHHPEEPDAKNGYFDIHLTFCNRGVHHQWLVWESAGHFSQITTLGTHGGVTAYHLPFWHFTTPLVAKPRHESSARRWVLLGTFLYQ
jgi:hypothetical protein